MWSDGIRLIFYRNSSAPFWHMLPNPLSSPHGLPSKKLGTLKQTTVCDLGEIQSHGMNFFTSRTWPCGQFQQSSNKHGMDYRMASPEDP